MKIIQSVERAFNILELLDDQEKNSGLGVLEISRLLDLKQPTVHNFLQTLLQLGYISQDVKTSKYKLSESARYLGWNGNSKKRLTEIARPIAQQLYNEFNETVVLTSLSGSTRMTLFHINSSRVLSVRPGTDLDRKFYSSGTGRCILSSLTETERDNVIKSNGLPTPEEWPEVTDRKGLDAELAKISKAGYATYRLDGIIAIGASINVPETKLNAALGIFLPEFRFEGEHAKSIINKLIESAQKITMEYQNV